MIADIMKSEKFKAKELLKNVKKLKNFLLDV